MLLRRGRCKYTGLRQMVPFWCPSSTVLLNIVVNRVAERATDGYRGVQDSTNYTIRDFELAVYIAVLGENLFTS